MAELDFEWPIEMYKYIGSSGAEDHPLQIETKIDLQKLNTLGSWNRNK